MISAPPWTSRPAKTTSRVTVARRARNHDALNAMVRSVLSSGVLGQHQGLPVSIVVRTTLQDLQAGTGVATPAGTPCCRCPR